MPRRVTCAGGCGQLLYLGRGSLPEPTCRQCRRARPGAEPQLRIPVDRTCAVCGISYRSNQPRSRYCTPTCRQRAADRRKGPGTPAHYAGDYPRQARQVRAEANANPDTECWRCHMTLAEIHHFHPQAKWTAGHLIDGLAGGPLAAECSPCNYANGARRRHALARRQRAELIARRTELTW